MGRSSKTTPEERGSLAWALGCRDAHEPPRNYGPEIAARWVAGFEAARENFRRQERIREAARKADRQELRRLGKEHSESMNELALLAGVTAPEAAQIRDRFVADLF